MAYQVPGMLGTRDLLQFIPFEGLEARHTSSTTWMTDVSMHVYGIVTFCMETWRGSRMAIQVRSARLGSNRPKTVYSTQAVGQKQGNAALIGSKTARSLSLVRPIAVWISNTARPSAHWKVRIAVTNQPLLCTAALVGAALEMLGGRG